jgi:hypothetical protein
VWPSHFCRVSQTLSPDARPAAAGSASPDPNFPATNAVAQHLAGCRPVDRAGVRA